MSVIAAIRLYFNQQLPHLTFEESPDTLYVHDRANHPEAEVCLGLDGPFCLVCEFDRCYNTYCQRYAIDMNDPHSLPNLVGIVTELLASDGLFVRDNND